MGLVLLLGLALRSFVYCPDDAFITFRYSRNLADGFGPIFNPGLPERVEGFSCPLYMLIMAILHKLPLGIDLLYRAKFFGLFSAGATLVVAQKLTKALKLPVWAIVAAPILIAMHPSISIGSIDGMETVFASLLAALACLWTLRAFEKEEPTFEKGKAPLIAGGFFAALALTRPEGVLYGLFAVIALVVSRRGKVGKAGIQFAASFLAPVILYFLWRKLFYGLWMPNTYYAKGAPLEEAIEKGAPYLLRTFFYQLNNNAVAAGAGLIWWLMASGGVISDRLKRFPGIVLPLAVLGQIIFSIRSGGDWMNGWRYMAAIVPIGTVLVLAGLNEAGQLLTEKKPNPRLTSGLGTAGAALVILFSLWGQTTFWSSHGDGYISWAEKGWTFDTRKLLTGWLLDRAMVVSDKVKENVKEGEVVAYTEMGVTPYYCPKINFLDCDGLTDTGVATLPGARHAQIGVTDPYTTTNGVVGPYIKDVRKPGYMMQMQNEQPGMPFSAQPILEGAYDVAASFQIPGDNPEVKTFLIIWKRVP